MKFILMVLCLFASGIAEEPQELLDTQQPQTCNCSHVLNAEKELAAYPTIPSTSFTCWNKYDGYYADVEVDCTIFHYCQTWHFPTGLNETVKWDFACPEGTIFNQKILSCTEPGVSFECKESPDYFWVNYILTATPNPATQTNCNRHHHQVKVETQSAEILNTNRPASGSSSTQTSFHFENTVNTTAEDLATDSSEISQQQNSETHQFVKNLAPLGQEGSSFLPISSVSDLHTYLPFSSSSPQDPLLQNTKKSFDSSTLKAEQPTTPFFFANQVSLETNSKFFSPLDEFQSSTSFPERVFPTSSQEASISESYFSTGNGGFNFNPSEHPVGLNSAEFNFEENQGTHYTKPPTNSHTETFVVISDGFSQFPTITYQHNLSSFSTIQNSGSNNFQTTQSADISATNGVPYNEVANSSFLLNYESDTVLSNQLNNSSSIHKTEYEESDLNSSAPYINRESITQQPEPLHFSTETNEHGSGSHQNEISQSTLNQENEDYTQNNSVDGLNTVHNTPTEHNTSQPSHNFESEVPKSSISEHSVVFPPSTPTYSDYYSNSYPQPTHGPGSDPIEFPSANSVSS